jgi:hypothetical protein
MDELYRRYGMVMEQVQLFEQVVRGHARRLEFVDLRRMERIDGKTIGWVEQRYERPTSAPGARPAHSDVARLGATPVAGQSLLGVSAPAPPAISHGARRPRRFAGAAELARLLGAGADFANVTAAFKVVAANAEKNEDPAFAAGPSPQQTRHCEPTRR